MSARVKKVPAARFDQRMVGVELEFFVPGVTQGSRSGLGYMATMDQARAEHEAVTGYPARKGIPWLKEATLDPEEIADWVERVHDVALSQGLA